MIVAIVIFYKLKIENLLSQSQLINHNSMLKNKIAVFNTNKVLAIDTTKYLSNSIHRLMELNFKKK